MLRTKSGTTWRICAAFLLLGLGYSPSLFGGPLIGVAPKPSPTPPSSPYQAPNQYLLSGYVYVDQALTGTKVSGDAGITGVTLTLTEYAISNPSVAVASFSTLTNSAGFYQFNFNTLFNTTAGSPYFYALQETQSPNYPVSHANTIGHFLAASGGSLASPTSPLGSSSVGQFSPNSGLSSDTITNIYLPPTSTPGFAGNGLGGKYTLLSYNFGDYVAITSGTGGGHIGKPPPAPGVPGTGGGGVPGSAQLATSLFVAGGNNRFLTGSNGGALGLTGVVSNTAPAGSANLNWQVSSQSSGVSLNPTSANGVAPGSGSPLVGTISGASLSPGTQTASVSFSAPGASPASSTSNITIDPVTSRKIDSVTSVDYGRMMVNTPANPGSFTLTSTGSHDKYTNLTANAAYTQTAPNSQGVFTLNGVNAGTLDGTTTQLGGNLSATFSTVGPISGKVGFLGDVGSPSLFTAETLASGTPIRPHLDVPYTATILEQRQLSASTGDPSTPFVVPTTGGGLLYGAVVSVPAGLTVQSNNAHIDANHATMVYVGGSSLPGETVSSFSTADGTTQVGSIAVTRTLVDGSVAHPAVPVAVGAYAFGPISATGQVSVATAESASVGDPGGYASLNVGYTIANVGFAATGGTAAGSPNVQRFGAPLSASIPAGKKLAPSDGGTSLTSRVAAAGTTGAASTTTTMDGSTLSAMTTGSLSHSDVTKTVGSQADILDSSVLGAAANVTMAWRNRDNDENGSFTGPHSTILPGGVQWLTSDVVAINGVPANAAYALQMTYDDRINTVIGGAVDTATVSTAYLAKLVGNTWENAVLDNNTAPGNGAQTSVAESLTDFLNSKYSSINPATSTNYTLDDLIGSWGVDTTNHQSWAVVNNGNGQFAIVPEPSTFVLLAAGAFTWMTSRAARRKANAKKA